MNEFTGKSVANSKNSYKNTNELSSTIHNSSAEKMVKFTWQI